MRIFVAQINPTVGAIQKNVKKIIEFIRQVRRSGGDLVVFPEMALCGYPPEDLVFQDAFLEEMEVALNEVAKESSGLMVVVGLVRKNSSTDKEKGLFNSAAVIQNGQVVGFYDKRLLPTYDVFDERRYFDVGHNSGIFAWKGKKIGVLICEDLWEHSKLVKETSYPVDPVIELAQQKPDVVLNLSASPYDRGKLERRLKVCQKGAKTLRAPVILCCLVGGQDQLVFDGYSLCVDAQGVLVGLGKGFQEDLFEVKLDQKMALPSDPLQDLFRALVLGLRDYFHKQGFSKAVLGLSGGIDSALVACIAKEALGKENVTALAMPSRYSSEESLKDARELAENLGISLAEVSIEEPFEAYLKTAQGFFQGKCSDLTEQNLQARIRGMILMAFSNETGALVLSTGNKSELAVGYCTLYGDMVGALGVLADVTKGVVYALSNWINRDQEVIPRSILEKAPSAELKFNQKDTDSLPEYELLDQVVEGYVEEGLSCEEIVKKKGLKAELVKDLIQRIQRAEYKRRQAPPGIKVSKKAFFLGRRFPIVLGGAGESGSPRL